MRPVVKNLHVASRRLRKLIYSKTGFDFKNGYRASSANGRQYSLAFNTSDYFGIDARGEWEKNRFQEIIPEAIRFYQTGAEKHIAYIVQVISSWIDENPVGYGRNWLCAMEVGIRAANWLLVYNIIYERAAIDHGFFKKFLKSINDHQQYIYQNLEVTVKSPLANHYLSDIGGLLYIALLHPKGRNKKLLKKAITELEDQMKNQVLPDGVSFENSIAYHRYVLEIYLYCAVICRRHGIELSGQYWQKLEKMLEFVMYYTRPDGNAPGFGDSDDGVWHSFLKSTKENINDHRYLLSLGAIIFQRADFKEQSDGFHSEYSAILPGYTEQMWDQIASSRELSSHAYKSGGIYILRHGELYLSLITANTHSHPIQLHKHNDIGSFELCVGAAPFIIDSGTYCYTSQPELRELFRSTSSHNTVRIDGQEQQDMKAAGFFALPRTANVELRYWQVGEYQDEIEFSYQHSLKDNTYIEVIRNVIFKKQKEEWVVNDSFTGEGEHTLEWFFHIHPDVKISLKENCADMRMNGRQLSVKLPDMHFDIIDSEVSFSYGKKQPSKVLRGFKKSSFPLSVSFQFQVYK